MFVGVYFMRKYKNYHRFYREDLLNIVEKVFFLIEEHFPKNIRKKLA